MYVKDLLRGYRYSIYGGLATFVITAMGVFFLGNLSGYEAKQLLQQSLSGIIMLCNTIVLGSATILALLLTVIGISRGTSSDLKDSHYHQLVSIAKLDTFLFVGAIVLFQLFNLPVTEAENVPTRWYDVIYWATIFFSSLLSGVMVTVILMLYNTVSNIIYIVGIKDDHPMVSDEDEENNENKVE